ncbi:hypothetical protein Salat_1720300 [Sesamum alatum]|uniref:Uncharacterized protein n=1 Tax=Sesamum alatum TaxID=300844 RepID=A0AAE1Y8B9_9LAMI|nr:hypothetical protein Salat_1720300 [Sesamum alatum]
MHHGGEFIEEPKLYVGGEVDNIDFCEGDNMSLSLIDSSYKICSASQGLTTNPPNTSAFTRANEQVMSPTPLSVKEPEARMGVGGVTLKSNFKKGGKEHVTLTSLQAVTRSRAQSTQQSSNAM